MGLPNCTRSLAYGTVMASTWSAAPSISALASVAARSTSSAAASAPPRRRAGVSSKTSTPSSRVRSMADSGAGRPSPQVDRVDGVVGLDHGDVGRRRVDDRGRLPAQPHLVPRPRHVRPLVPGAAATQPTAEPSASASRQSLVPASARASLAAQRTQGHDGGQERRRHQMTTDLLAQHGHLDHAQPEAALVFGHLERQPTLVGHGRPDRAVVAVRRVGHAVGRRRRPPRAGCRPPTRSRPGPAARRDRRSRREATPRHRAGPPGRLRGRSPRRRSLRRP